MVTGYMRRRFSLGAEESLECDMRIEEHDGVTFVILREPTSQRQFGALTARFEQVANLVTVELTMKGLQRRPVRFFHYLPAFDNGLVSAPAKMQEVHLTTREGQYHYARWVPVDVPTVVWLSE